MSKKIKESFLIEEDAVVRRVNTGELVRLDTNLPPVLNAHALAMLRARAAAPTRRRKRAA